MRSLKARHFLAGLTALFGCVALGVTSSCSKTSDVSFVLHLAADAKESTQWLELGVYASGTCPTVGQLSGGVPRGGLLRRVGFENGQAPPTFAFARGQYSFAATARNSQCEVVAAGCTAIELPGAQEVTVDLKAVTTKGGRCTVGSACRDAECVPAPMVAMEGCALEVVGAGPLDAMVQTGVTVSRPAIAAVNDGFVIAYNQFSGDRYRITTMKVGLQGSPVEANETTASPFNGYDFPGACADDAKTEGLGLSFDAPTSPTGLLIAPRWPSCTGSASLLSIFPTLPDAHFQSGEAKTPLVNTLTKGHVLSNRSLSAGGYFTSVIDEQAYLQVLSAAGPSSSTQPVGGPPPHARSWIAATSEALAVLVQSAGDESAAADGGVAPTGPELRLELARRDNVQALTMQDAKLPGRFGALAMKGARVVVLSSGGLEAPVDYNLLNVGDTAFKTGSLVVGDTGQALAADVAVSGDRMIIASMSTGGVSVTAFDHFSGEPVLLKQKVLARDARVKPFMGGVFDSLRDGYVSVAAEGARVAVVWMNGQRIAPGEDVGGWAVLGCR